MKKLFRKFEQIFAKLVIKLFKRYKRWEEWSRYTSLSKRSRILVLIGLKRDVFFENFIPWEK